MRNPVQLYRTLGARSFWGFQFFIGFSTFTFLSAPVVWGMALLAMAGIGMRAMPAWLIWLSVGNLMLNIGSNWLFTVYCAVKEDLNRPENDDVIKQGEDKRLLQAALLFPLYLILHSVASYKAFWQLIVNPHYWEKTTHGLCLKSPLRPALEAA